jgi:hypothetical protein
MFRAWVFCALLLSCEVVTGRRHLARKILEPLFETVDDDIGMDEADPSVPTVKYSAEDFTAAKAFLDKFVVDHQYKMIGDLGDAVVDDMNGVNELIDTYPTAFEMYLKDQTLPLAPPAIAAAEGEPPVAVASAEAEPPKEEGTGFLQEAAKASAAPQCACILLVEAPPAAGACVLVTTVFVVSALLVSLVLSKAIDAIKEMVKDIPQTGPIDIARDWPKIERKFDKPKCPEGNSQLGRAARGRHKALAAIKRVWDKVGGGTKEVAPGEGFIRGGNSQFCVGLVPEAIEKMVKLLIDILIDRWCENLSIGKAADPVAYEKHQATIIFVARAIKNCMDPPTI